MSGSNYFYCAKCDCKSVYTSGDEEDDNVDVETGYPLPDGNVGRMVLLCKECAKKHIIKIEDRAIIQQQVQPDIGDAPAILDNTVELDGVLYRV